MRIRVAVLDIAGTTVADDVGGRPFVLAVYERVLAEVGIELPPEELNEKRGLDKREVLRAVLGQRLSLDETALEAEAERLLRLFETCSRDLLGRVRPMPGALAACRWLEERGIYLALASGLPQSIALAMARATGLFEPGPVDYVTSGEKAGGGRPGPEMINDVLIHGGFREGRRIGAMTVAVASGTHGPERLRREKPLQILPSIADLPRFLEERL
jgi:beta-phosphoglucomutase-like phosphatase (HAD superfamily)